MVTHSSIPPWRIPWTVEPSGLGPWGNTELDTTERLSTHILDLGSPSYLVSSVCMIGGLWTLQGLYSGFVISELKSVSSLRHLLLFSRSVASDYL